MVAGAEPHTRGAGGCVATARLPVPSSRGVPHGAPTPSGQLAPAPVSRPADATAPVPGSSPAPAARAHADAARARHIQADLAVIEHHDAIGQRARLGHVLGDQHQRKPVLPPQPHDLLLHHDTARCIQRPQRFVQQQQPRPMHQCTHQRDPPTLAAGQRGRPRVAAHAQAHRVQRLLRLRTTGPAPHDWRAGNKTGSTERCDTACCLPAPQASSNQCSGGYSVPVRCGSECTKLCHACTLRNRA